MQKYNGRKVVTQLIKAYEEEAKIYEGLAQAAQEQHFLLKNGRDPKRLAALVEQQSKFAEHIGKIEAGIAPLREYWENIRDAARDSHVRALAKLLDKILEELAERIHTIVELEKDNSRELLKTMSAAGA